MEIIEQKAQSGPDGVLRVEASTGHPDAKCTVIIYVNVHEKPDGDDPWKQLRQRLTESDGHRTVKLPPARKRQYRRFVANELPGPSASHIVARDRR